MKTGSKTLLVLTALLGMLLSGCTLGKSTTEQAAALPPPDSALNFTALALGVSVATPVPNKSEDELNITLTFDQAPFELQELTVHKFLNTGTSPFSVHDAVYTCKAANGDTLILTASGTAAGPTPPTGMASAHEYFTVTGGTGRFAGASGAGEIYSVVALEAMGPNRSAVSKHFSGTITFGTANFTAQATGVSVATSRPDNDNILDITLTFDQAPFGLKDLTVHKFLNTNTSPFTVHDATYICATANGDTLTLTASGTALPPGPPIGMASARESFTVTGGTGIFLGASGKGEIISVVALDSLGRDKSAVTKHFTGTISVPRKP